VSEESLPCWVYKSPRTDEMYLYVTREGDFAPVPRELLDRFGAPQFVTQIALHAGRRLARENPLQVMRNLRDKGFHLQLPPADAARQAP